MAMREIPQSFEFECDRCGTVEAKNSASRPSYCFSAATRPIQSTARLNITAPQLLAEAVLRED